MPEEQVKASPKKPPQPSQSKFLGSSNVKTPEMVVVACLSLSKVAADKHVKLLGKEKADKLVDLYAAVMQPNVTEKQRLALREALQLPEQKEAEKPAK